MTQSETRKLSKRLTDASKAGENGGLLRPLSLIDRSIGGDGIRVDEVVPKVERFQIREREDATTSAAAKAQPQIRRALQ